MKHLRNNPVSLLFILCAMLASSCAEGGTYAPRKITAIDEYRSKPCWFDGQDRFKSFVILQSSGRGYYPIFVSRFCEFYHDGKTFGDSVLAFPDAFPLSGDGGRAMSMGLIDRNIVSNTISEGPDISDQARVFYVEADTLLKNEFQYELIKIYKMTPVDITVRDFLKDDRMRRSKLALR